MKPVSLYIHVPFCLRRCSYCDFAVTATREPPIAAWLEGIERELRTRLDANGWDRLHLSTLYLGGGTPSLIGNGGMAELAGRLARYADLDTGFEWTAEANPETFTAELAREWRTAGVNRVSLGVQTFHGETLRWMGRMHGPDGPVRAVAAARAAGLDNVSVDLIFGLPERMGRDWSDDLERILALRPEHVALYGLTAEPATPLGGWVRAGRETLASDETYRQEYLLAAERMADAGFVHYEVSNFARPGRESRHNSAYWKGVPYLGLGPGAHSFLPPRRSWNVRDYAEWQARVASGDAVEDTELVEGGAASLERTWLGLRTRDGLAGLSSGQIRLARSWERAGLARLGEDRVRLSPEGWLLLDRLAIEMEDASAQDPAERRGLAGSRVTDGQR